MLTCRRLVPPAAALASTCIVLAWLILVYPSTQVVVAVPASSIEPAPLRDEAAGGLDAFPAPTPLASACPAQCTLHGNCNELTGECTCPMTRRGASCEHATMPSCVAGGGGEEKEEEINFSLLASDGFWARARAGLPSHLPPKFRWLGLVGCACIREAVAVFSLQHAPSVPEWPSRLDMDALALQRVVCVEARETLGNLWQHGRWTPATSGAVEKSFEDWGGSEHQRHWSYVPIIAWLKQSPAHSPLLLPSFTVTEAAYLAAASSSSAILSLAPPHTPPPAPLPPRQLGAMLPPLARLRLLPARACGRLGCGGLGWCGQLPHEPSPRCRCAARLAHEAPPAAAAAAAACATRGPELWRHSAGGARRTRCPNGCGGAGRCVLGFCHCAAGAWGLDCGMSAARAAALLRGGARPKVFVYELPPALRRSCNAWRLPEDVADRLLRSEHLSPTPAAADYFWYYGCPNGDMVLPALRWIWRTYPMWNDSVRRGTPRHVMVVAHEEGWAEVWRYLVEWLRHTPGGDHANSGGRWDAIHPASASRQLAVLQLSGNSDYTPPGVARRQRCVSAGARCYLCFQPGKDVVIPAAPGLVDYPDEQMCARFAARQERRDAWGGALQRTGDRVFFSGAIWTKPRGNGFYEASRLVPYRCHRHAREARVHLRQTETALEAVQPSEIEPPVDSVGFAARAEMCVVPEGKAGSYGHRALAAVQLGCVPLFTKERFSFDFFHEAINWTEAAVFVPPVEMPRLLQMLPSGEELLRMRRAGARLRRRLLWTSIYGDCHLPRGDGHEPDAFDTLMQVLRQPRRYFKLSSVHYAPRAPELLKDLDPWLEAHGGASCEHSMPARRGWASEHPNETEPWMLISSGRCSSQGGRLLTESECRAYAHAEGLHFIGSTIERREYPGCVNWEGLRVEFNEHEDESIGCNFGQRARCTCVKMLSTPPSISPNVQKSSKTLLK